MSLSIVNAGQVLRPLEDGRPYLRQAEFSSEPGAANRSAGASTLVPAAFLTLRRATM